MKRALVIIFFLLLLSPVLALESDYSKVITTGEEIQLPQGTIHLLYPTTVKEDELFAVELLFYPNVSEGRFTLYREGFPLLPQSAGPEIGEETSYFYLSWSDSLQRNSTYLLQYVVNDSVVYEKRFVLIVTSKPIQSQTEESTSLPVVAADEDTLDVTRSLLLENGLADISLEEIKRFQNTGEKSTIVSKSLIHQNIIYEDGTTKNKSVVVIKIEPLEYLEKLDVIEHIPKSFASRVKYVFFNKEIITLQDDPVIMWHLEQFDKPIELSYAIDKSTEVTGNTVLLGQTRNNTSLFNWKLVGPLLVIPLIALFVIFFNRFSPSKNNAPSQKKKK